MDPNPILLCPYPKKRFGHRDRHTHRGERHVKMKADWGSDSPSHRRPKTARKPLEAKREARHTFSYILPKVFRRNQPC